MQLSRNYSDRTTDGSLKLPEFLIPAKTNSCLLSEPNLAGPECLYFDSFVYQDIRRSKLQGSTRS